MPLGDVPRAFDTIAPAYDTTRDPIDPGTLEEVGRLLRRDGVGSLLEVGVGTGRVAGPLTALGFAVTGLDASRGMLARARAKGLLRLVRGSAYRLPFATGSVDGTLLVHVLHLLDDPVAALSEATRVGRHGAYAIVRPGGPAARPGEPERDRGRRVVYRILAERGYPIPPGAQGGPPVKERALLQRIPPDRLTVVCDREVTEPVAKRLEMLAQGASRHTMHIPREELRRAVAAARAEIGDRTFSYRRVEALAVWSAERLSERSSGALPA
jgi:SAM-dependent methyltransferase